MHIYTLPRVPGATITTPWETFCHSRSPFVVIKHSNLRAVNRWESVGRKRKFGVTLFKRNSHGRYNSPTTSWYTTLKQAEKAAARIVAEQTAGWDTAKDDGWKGVNRAGDTDMEWLKKDGEKS